MKNSKCIFTIIGVLVAVAAIFVSIVVFREQISEFLEDVKKKAKSEKLFKNEEYEDFADI